jgi:hypothetical protein
MNFLEKMKEQHKLILTEFNCIGSPTNNNVRNSFEQSFGIKWTGWTGRYFHSLDTLVNTELPAWVVRNYKKQHNNQWPFKKPGVVFVNNEDKVVILEKATHLNDPMPKITTGSYGIQHFGLPQEIVYPFWFDVITPDENINKVIARFQLDLNAQGKKELAQNNIPLSFPAVQMHNNKDYSFYYFSADFSDNPVRMYTAYFKSIEYFKFLFISNFDEENRSGFFWNYYQPLIRTILKDYYSTLNK